MFNIQHAGIVSACVLTLSFPFSYAFAASAIIQALSPGATVMANTRVTFTLVPSGFTAPTYRVTDSFSPTTISANNIEPGGKVSWTPEKTDVGTHTITIAVSDNDGHTASVVQTITVLPPPSIAITSVSPGPSVMPGTTFTFSVVPTGYTSPSYVISDSFGGTTIVSTDISAAGLFSWKPDQSQNGDHIITVYASDSQGHYSSANTTVRVGAGPILTVSPIVPGTNLNVGQSVTFSLGALNFSPTAYSLNDAFSGVTTVTNNNLTLNGNFSWTPQASDAGVHTITFTGRIGAYGESASTSVTLAVNGPNGTVPTNAQQAPVVSASSSTTLADLQAQLALLQSKMASQSNVSAPAPTIIVTSTLRTGSSGSEVRKLQELLGKHGYMTVAPNGYFGPSTLAAVKKFQTAQGLDPLGIVGPGTRAALNLLAGGDAPASVSSTSTSASASKYIFEHFMGVGDDEESEVTQLQQRLIADGFMTGAPTGYFGSATERAVKKFQRTRGIPETGYVNKQTRAALNAG